MGIKKIFSFLKNDDEDVIEERIDPIVEQRRKEKFSMPLIIDEFDEIEEKKPVEKKVVVKKPKIEQLNNVGYTMTEIISPISGKKEEKNHRKTTIKKVEKRKQVAIKDQLVPVISPFFGVTQEIEKEVKEVKEVREAPTKKKVIVDTNDEINSVTQNLRNLSKLIQSEDDKLRIIEAETGKFQLDFSNMKREEDSIIDDLNDEMTLDELMSLYEKSKSSE